MGLALERGGALRLAHIGVIRWFEAPHIPVDHISSTSMGAFIADPATSLSMAEPAARLGEVIVGRRKIFASFGRLF